MLFPAAHPDLTAAPETSWPPPLHPSLPGATSVSSRSALSQPLSQVRWEVFDHEDYVRNDSEGRFLPLSL